jgi:DNA-directed RNA polymerase
MLALRSDGIDRLGAQLSFEQHLHEEAQEKLRSRTEEMAQKGYYSMSVPGTVLLRESLALCAEQIRNNYISVSRKPGPDHAEIGTLLRDADHEKLALVTIKVVLDQLMRMKEGVELTRCSAAVGRAVQMELRMEFYADTRPDLFKMVTTSRFHKASGAHYKAASMGNTMAKVGVVSKPWANGFNVRVGNWLIGSVKDATGWLDLDLVRTGKKATTYFLRVSQVLGPLLDEINTRAEGLAFLRYPLKSSPRDWELGDDGEYHGGYIDEAIHVEKIIRTHSPIKAAPGPVALAAINQLQRVAYRINPVILDTALLCKESRVGKVGDGTAGGSFHYAVEVEQLPKYLNPDEDQEGFKAYKRMKKEIYDHNAQLKRENVRTAELLHVAERFRNETFFIPWNFDYRGRMYPISTVLSPQGIDFEKALLYFAEEGPVNEEWLAFQVATTFGHDKATMAERIAWARANTEVIGIIAQDPFNSLQDWWSGAAEPWSFLAACCEYYTCCIAKTKTTSGLPVGIDATCSGLQHLSAMTLDRTAAGLVNVVPGEAVADGYKAVADAAKPHLPEHTREWMNRKVTKRTVMTVPYGVSRHGARGYIREQLMSDGRDLTEEGLLTTITNAIYDKAMREVFQGPITVMNWIKRAAKEAIESQDHLRWVSPSGFEVIQDQRTSIVRKVKTSLFGSANVQLDAAVGYGDKDPAHHASSCAPNLVHSVDAALLHFLVSDWEAPISCIHDCVLGRSCDMGQLAQAVRVHFCEIYRGTDLLADWARDVGVEPNPELIVGDLDIEGVVDSEYFFC